jgi:phosphopantothenoylcysteine synthetase/decarboxylase
MDVTLTVLASLAARKRPEVVRDLREQGRAA